MIASIHHKNVHKTLLVVSIALLLSGCSGTSSQNVVSSTIPNVSERQSQDVEESIKLRELTESYFAESLALSPVYATFVGVNDYNDRFSDPLNAKSLAKGLAFEKKYLEKINLINSTHLSGQDLLSYEIFKRDREIGIKGYEFPSHLIPISQMGGAHSYFAMLGSGSSAQPFATQKDYQDFVKRADGFAVFMDSVIAMMTKGIELGVVHPRPIAEKLLPQLAAHVVTNVEDSVFYGPVKALDENVELTEKQKQQIKQAHIEMIENVIVPSYKKVHDFVENTYLPKTRDTVGISELPNGKAWYEYRIETNTTLPLTAQSIHDFGKREVARILAEMKQVKTTVNFDGDLPAFFEFLRTDDQFYYQSEQALIDGYMQVKDDINARLPKLFEVFPKADYVVKAVEPYRAKSAAGASYMAPAPDGSRPGVFYINAYDLKAQPKFLLETLSIHEAAPGHHFQIAIQQEVEGLPDFRKFGGYTVFAEGWALYAESLGKELGLFSDPYMWYGRLADEQLRAMRLVVDTGLHAFSWTREEAIDYMRANSSMAQSDIVAEVERYISIGGQALAYKTGERHIRMLRNRCAQELGSACDIRKFHTQILIDGALPMPILSTKIDRWIAAQK